MRYNTQTNDLIRASGEKARLLGHSYVGTVHILLALLEQPGEVGLLLRSLGAEPELAGTMVQLQYGTGTPDLPLPQGLTKKARELLRMAAREARGNASREILPVHVLMALSRTENTEAGKLLQIFGIGPNVLFTHTVEWLRREAEAPAASMSAVSGSPTGTLRVKASATSPETVWNFSVTALWRPTL